MSIITLILIIITIIVTGIFTSVYSIKKVTIYEKAMKYSIKGHKLILKFLKKHTDINNLLSKVGRELSFTGIFFNIKIKKINHSTELMYIYINSSYKAYEMVINKNNFKWKVFKSVIKHDLISLLIESFDR